MSDLITCGDYKQGAAGYDLAVFDPPFDTWDKVNWRPKAKAYACFTNFQNRQYVEKFFGAPPKFEIIWFFKDGRWVSHNMPRLTHEHILIYGELNFPAYVGEYTKDKTPNKKGRGCIGRDKNLGERVYTPRDRKMLNSVLEVPRNVGKALGVWGKPLGLAQPLLEWLVPPDGIVWDGFAGSGTFGVMATKLGMRYEGFEINPDTCVKANARIAAEASKLDYLSLC